MAILESIREAMVSSMEHYKDLPLGEEGCYP